MKTLLIALSFCLLFILNSCNNTPKNSSTNNSKKTEKLYIKTISATGVDKNQVKTETISEVTTDYFEVGLGSLTTGGYSGQKDIITPEVGKEFKFVFFYIVKKDGSNITFTTSTEFLNFMSARGYEMVDQLKNNYGADYTFKKRKE
jgi:hypothetical protein